MKKKTQLNMNSYQITYREMDHEVEYLVEQTFIKHALYFKSKDMRNTTTSPTNWKMNKEVVHISRSEHFVHSREA